MLTMETTFYGSNVFDENDPDNFPYDNVEFPVRKQTTLNQFSPKITPKLVITPDKSPLETVFEFDVSETKDNSTDFKMVDRNQIGLQETQTIASPHLSTVLFTKQSNNSNNTSGPAKDEKVSPIGCQDAPKSHEPTLMTASIIDSSQPSKVPSNSSNSISRSTPSNPWPFERNDLNTLSRRVLDEAFNNHDNFGNLQKIIIREGYALQKPLQKAKDKIREKLTYEQLLQGMLFNGEKILLNGHWVYYTRVEFYNETCTEEVRPSLGNGRACLTNKRLLLLVAEPSTDANLRRLENESYLVSLSQTEDISYLALPMHCFRSVEMSVSIGSTATAKIRRSGTSCGCLGRKKWRKTDTAVSVHNSRTVQLGLVMPPWNENTRMVIHVHPELPLTISRDFVATVQSHSQQLH